MNNHWLDDYAKELHFRNLRKMGANIPACPCGETRMQGTIISTGEHICWQGHIITKNGEIAEHPADVFVA